MCRALKESDSVPIPDKCPSIDKADWLICLLQTKYENIIKNRIVSDEDRHSRDAKGNMKNVRVIRRRYTYIRTFKLYNEKIFAYYYFRTWRRCGRWTMAV